MVTMWHEYETPTISIVHPASINDYQRNLASKRAYHTMH